VTEAVEYYMVPGRYSHGSPFPAFSIPDVCSR